MLRHRSTIFSVLAAWCMAGCLGPSADLSASGGISLRTEPAKDFYFESARVYRQGESTVIEGRMRGRHEDAADPGHMDAALFGPEGELLAKASVKLVPRRHRNRGHSEYTFHLALKLTMPNNAVVRLVQHSGPGGATPDCGDNQAVPAP